jgi:hypothetical protein
MEISANLGLIDRGRYHYKKFPLFFGFLPQDVQMNTIIAVSEGEGKLLPAFFDAFVSPSLRSVNEILTMKNIIMYYY